VFLICPLGLWGFVVWIVLQWQFFGCIHWFVFMVLLGVSGVSPGRVRAVHRVVSPCSSWRLVIFVGLGGRGVLEYDDLAEVGIRWFLCGIPGCRVKPGYGVAVRGTRRRELVCGPQTLIACWWRIALAVIRLAEDSWQDDGESGAVVVCRAFHPSRPTDVGEPRRFWLGAAHGHERVAGGLSPQVLRGGRWFDEIRNEGCWSRRGRVLGCSRGGAGG